MTAASPVIVAAKPTRAKSETIAFAIMVAFFLIAPLFIYPLFLMKALCFALFACAFNLLIGYVGLLSFGHALYFGWASYLSAYSAKAWGFPPELAILTGTLTAAVFGFVAGSLAIRRQGIYFAMITLALAQMMFFFAVQAKFTGGEDGIQAVPRGHLLGLIDLHGEMAMYMVVLAIFLGGFVDLRPPVIRIPRERYIVDYEDASYDDVYDALADGPIDELERRYSLDEIRQTQYLRDRVRRVDLDSVNFEFGSWEVPPGQYGRLERVARAINRVLDRDPDAIFMVEGHTDAVGSFESNYRLSEARAASLRRLLVREFGIPSYALETVGYGEEYLLVNTPYEDWHNRRVTLRRIDEFVRQ